MLYGMPINWKATVLQSVTLSRVVGERHEGLSLLNSYEEEKLYICVERESRSELCKRMCR
jgi:hypothetical protein